jgi:flagellar basal-body rod modification protein FlgD
MSDTLPIDGLIGRMPTSFETTSDPGSIDKNGFLTLLIEQLKHQDPMNPQDSSQFSAQLAQYSTLEEMQNLNSLTEQGIELDAVLAQSINNTMASNLVGKEVKAVGGEIFVQDGESGSIAFDLGNVGSDVEITIKDLNGNVVRTLEEHKMQAGEHVIDFDGKDYAGRTLPNGTYSVEINTVDSDGTKSAVYPYLVGTVEAVRYESTGAVLIVDGMRVEFGNVIEVREGTGTGEDDPNLDPGNGTIADMIGLLGL